MKKLIIFDLYNTLITDEGINARREYRINAVYSLLEAQGLPIRFSQVRDAYDAVIAALAESQKERLSPSVFEVVRSFCKRLPIEGRALFKKIYEVWSFAGLQISPALIEGVPQGLALLKEEGCLLAMISNTSSTPGIALRFIMDEMGIYDYFDDLVFSDEFGLMKPKTIIFNRVLQRFNLPAESAVFIGDHKVYDKLGAEQAGIAYLPMNPSLNFMKVARQALEL